MMLSKAEVKFQSSSRTKQDRFSKPSSRRVQSMQSGKVVPRGWQRHWSRLEDDESDDEGEDDDDECRE